MVTLNPLPLPLPLPQAEELHLVSGPRRKEAAAAFAQEVLEGLEALHAHEGATSHIVHCIEVHYQQQPTPGTVRPPSSLGSRPPSSAGSRMHRPSEAGWAAGPGPSSAALAAASRASLSFTMADLRDPMRKVAALEALAAAARHTPQVGWAAFGGGELLAPPASSCPPEVRS